MSTPVEESVVIRATIDITYTLHGTTPQALSEALEDNIMDAVETGALFSGKMKNVVDYTVHVEETGQVA